MYIISTLLIARVTDRVLMDEANKSARNMLEITSARIEQVLKSTEANTSAVAWVARESITDDRRLYMITKRFVEETPVITGSAIAIGDTLPGALTPGSIRNSSEVTTTTTSRGIGSSRSTHRRLSGATLISILTAARN